jgi:hypothetical protein
LLCEIPFQLTNSQLRLANTLFCLENPQLRLADTQLCLEDLPLRFKRKLTSLYLSLFLHKAVSGLLALPFTAILYSRQLIFSSAPSAVGGLLVLPFKISLQSSQPILQVYNLASALTLMTLWRPDIS